MKTTSLKTQRSKSSRYIIYYDLKRRNYWLVAGDGFININLTGAKRFLRADGFSPKIKRGRYISQLDAEILRIQTERTVDWSMREHPSLGRGVHEIDGKTILVQRGYTGE